MKIIESHNAGKSELRFDLPDTFDVGNLEPKDAQLIIYSRLIERVEANQLKVALVKTKGGSSILKINWPAMLDPSERERMKRIIISHLVED